MFRIVILLAFCSWCNAELLLLSHPVGYPSFMCYSVKNAVAFDYVCDGKNDCSDGSDEKYCKETTNGAPLITPNLNSITLWTRVNFTLTCQASEPITWKYDANIETTYEKMLGSPFKPEISHDSKKNGLFASSIELRDLDEWSEGSYYCVKESDKNDDLSLSLKANNASKIHVYMIL